ncbi:transcription termination/antitermination protein NusA [Helicobacter didelphidarum]|uniref:Transcription termination/antitermination protein NusA n=1 Tax=Helicobacter didelphidarum TaxID=2040648 RepID=A0A3D8IP96_9HELI|nr:transcription termination factor NusA [Helicobacter didelphidarum]RDU67042.1 transcription termination/antitermination protein NusA [Helicobacter didelphidarum]
MEKVIDIVSAIASENGLPENLVLEAIKESMIKMAQKEINEDANFVVLEDSDTKDLRLAQKMIVCDDKDFDNTMESTHISLTEASKLVESVNIGDELEYQIDLESMNRNAVNSIFYEINFQIQRLNEQEILRRIEKNINHIIIGIVVNIDNDENTTLEFDDTRGILPLKNRIKGEKFKIGQSVRCILKSARITRNGLKIELSRTTPKMLEELLMLEVPEIKDGEVIIQKIARIPGEKAKVALFTNNPKIDPIGSAVGSKGVRISAVSKELHGESIDCIEYSNVPEIFIAKALSPAQILSVKIQKEYENQDIESESQEKKPLAIVQIMQSQKPKAIGRHGVNIRLASMLTGYDFELKEVIEKEAKEQKENMNDGDSRDEKKLGLEALESLFKGNS